MCVSFEELVDGLPKEPDFSLSRYFNHEVYSEPDLDSYVSGGNEMDRKISMERAIRRKMSNVT